MVGRGTDVRAYGVSHERLGVAAYVSLEQWFDRVRERPATVRAYALAKEVNTAPVVSGETRSVLFDQDATTVR